MKKRNKNKNNSNNIEFNDNISINSNKKNKINKSYYNILLIIISIVIFIIIISSYIYLPIQLYNYLFNQLNIPVHNEIDLIDRLYINVSTNNENITIKSMNWSNDNLFLMNITKYKRPILIHRAPMLNEWSLLSKKWDLSTVDVNNIINLSNTRMQTNDSTFILGSERDKGGMLKNNRNIVKYINISLNHFIRNISNKDSYLYWTGELIEFEQNIRNNYKDSYIEPSTGSKLHNYTDGWSKLRIIDEGLEESVNESDLSQWRPMIWMSHPNVIAQTHYDTQHNFFLQISGIKSFHFFSPDSELYSYPNIHQSYRQSQMVLSENTSHLFPNFTYSHYYTVTVKPGDLLYIPPYWNHRVVSETFSVSLSVLSPSLLEIILADAYWQPVPFAQYKESLELRVLGISLLLYHIFDAIIMSNDSLSINIINKSELLQLFSINLFQSRYSILFPSTTLDSLYKHKRKSTYIKGFCNWSIGKDILHHSNRSVQLIIDSTINGFNSSANNIIDIIHSIDDILDSQIDNKLDRKIDTKIKESFLRDYIEQIVRWAVGVDDTPMYIYKCLAKY